jgi:hypothetical protein
VNILKSDAGPNPIPSHFARLVVTPVADSEFIVTVGPPGTPEVLSLPVSRNRRGRGAVMPGVHGAVNSNRVTDRTRTIIIDRSEVLPDSGQDHGQDHGSL